MSEEKLYAIRNNVGKYLTIERTAPWWDSQVGTTVRNIDVALAWAGKHGGHVVTFVEEPKKVVLSKEQAKIVEDAHGYMLPAEYITDNTDGGYESERLLMEAFVNGYTVAKEKKYNVKVPYAVNSYFKKIDANYCIAGYTSIVDLDEDLAQFTEADIEHYGLQDCEKEEVTDDEQ
ncbi:DUF1642 domain-containing protein [Lacticaseibacillus paracasei]|uniref:DUF1642 domain-containing protein n=1 Tax=Lacticaseibacillus paracasei TaxID=1597 RepID=UPI003F62F3B0